MTNIKDLYTKATKKLRNEFISPAQLNNLAHSASATAYMRKYAMIYTL